MSKLSLSLDISSNTNAFLYGTTASLVAGGYIPEFSLDLINDSYRSEKGNKPFTNLVEHNSATAGNATMTNSDGDIVWRPHNLLEYSEDLTQSTAYVDFGSTGNITIVDSTTVTFAAGAANLSNKTLETTNLVGQTITGAVELSSQTHAGEVVQLRFNWRSGDQATGSVYTLTTTPTFVYITATVPAGTTGVDLIVYHPSNEYVEKTFTATKWHVYRSDLGGMAPVPTDFQTAGSETYVRTAGREVTGIELVTNGTFDSDYSGWTNYNGGTISVANGELNISTDPSIQNTGVYQAINTVVGKVYRVSGDVTSVNSTPRLLIGTGIGSGAIVNLSHADHGETKTLADTFVATSTTTYISLQTAPISSQSKYDNISVKEVDVNPATARYLPRIGHHVYNGSTWVNEGLLHESEARTNVVAYSEDTSQWTEDGTATITNSTQIAPDGTASATLVDIGSTGSSLGPNRISRFSSNLSPSTKVTVSVFLKRPDTDAASYLNVRLFCAGTTATDPYVDYDTSDFTSVNSSGGVDTVLASEDYGNGWFRVSFTTTLDASATGSNNIRVGGVVSGSHPATGTDFIMWGAQVETGSTPSSYIPTSGATVTRAAETLIIPAANLPWPEPVIIGDELVTNGTFDTDSDWTKSSVVSISNGKLNFNATNTDFVYAEPTVPIEFVTGKVYQVTLDVDSVTSGQWQVFVDRDTDTVVMSSGSSGSFVGYFVADGTEVNIKIARKPVTTLVAVMDNFSVKEINPLSVSIAMDGRMTYSDNDLNTEFVFYDWFTASDNYLRTYFQTNDGTGKIIWSQNDEGTFDSRSSGGSDYAPDVLVPYNFAVRHGSTFINASDDGRVLTENNDPVNLPDASSVSLTIGKSATNGYMGTIGSFRVWANDIGDAGIIEASSPSLEPSLSLTFDGTETSFIVEDWSE